MTRVSAVGEQTSLADRKRRAGQRLVIGFAGPAVDDDLRDLVREIQPAGFVLFARNVVEPAQVRELNRELASLVPSSHPALLAVDQEGGRVQRIREPATRWPAMGVVGRAGTEATAEVSRAMALELIDMGFNLNFAPVADVNSNPKNPVIGDRSFGDKSGPVSGCVASFVEAHQAAGLGACIKHFPGHGDTSVDSHHALPVVERELPDLEHTELPPFAAGIAAGVGAVMSAHVVFPALDEEHPATLSDRVLPSLLRDRLGFDGLVFTDDMEMKAVHGRYPIADQVARATAASIDVMLVCETRDLQFAFFQELVRLQERRPHDTASEDSARRVMRWRERFIRLPRPTRDMAHVGARRHRDMAHELLERWA